MATKSHGVTMATRQCATVRSRIPSCCGRRAAVGRALDEARWRAGAPWASGGHRGCCRGGGDSPGLPLRARPGPGGGAAEAPRGRARVSLAPAAGGAPSSPAEGSGRAGAQPASPSAPSRRRRGGAPSRRAAPSCPRRCRRPARRAADAAGRGAARPRRRGSRRNGADGARPLNDYVFPTSAISSAWVRVFGLLVRRQHVCAVAKLSGVFRAPRARQLRMSTKMTMPTVVTCISV